nr:hypothetical protein [Tanacetum cinerariifolium]
GWDDYAFSVFTTNSEDEEGRPIFHRFAKADSMKAVPLPLSGDYTSLSDHSDLDESQMSYDHDSESDGVVAAKEFGMIASCDSENAIEEGAAKIYNLITGVDTEEASTGEFALMGVTSETRLDNHLSQTEKWRNSSKNLFRLIDSSMSVRTKVRLGFNNCIRENELGWDDYAFSVFTINYEDEEGRPIFHRFAKADSMKAVPPPLSGDYTSLSDHSDLDESQMSYGTKSSTSSDSKSVYNDFVSCDDSDKSSKVNTTDFTFSDSSVKSSEPKPKASTSCESISSVSTSGNEAEIESNEIRPFPVPTDRGYSPSEKPFLDVEDEEIFDSGCSRSMTDIEYLVLSKDFKLPDESMMVLRVPKKHNLYTINLNNLCPRGNLACLVVHASVDESVKWHRRMGHVNYKNINRLAKGNLVRGLPTKLFKNDHTCVACCKFKQHKASYKAIDVVSLISKPFQLLYMDLFGPTSIKSIDHKYYYIVITDDYSRFCWVFFLEHKDETYPILKDFLILVENQLNKKVKAIRCDNGSEFKNALMIELCGSKRIKREYSNARTPQQNGVTERKNRTLIEAARIMLVDSKLPTMFWTEAVRTACYVLNRVLADEGYIVGYSVSNKAYRVYNVPNKRVEETMNLRFLEEKPNVQGLGHEWYFELDYLTDNLRYNHVQANQSAGKQGATTNPVGTQDADSDSDCDEQVIIFPSYPSHSIQGTQAGDEVDDSLFNFAAKIFQKELARLKDQEHKGTLNAEGLGLGCANDAEELQKHASAKTVPPGCIPVPTGNVLVPLGSLPVPTGSILVSAGNTVVSTDNVPGHTSSSTDLFITNDPTTRFPSPSDLGNYDPWK